MRIFGTTGNDLLEDTTRRDRMFGDEGADVFILNRDGKRDFILDFEDGIDRIDLTDFNVTFDEVQIRQIDDLTFVFEIRGERTEVTFTAPAVGEPMPELTAEDFIFAEGAAPPLTISQLDGPGKDVLYGSSRPDIFIFTPDGSKDVVRRFELGKDQIDLSAYGVNFGDLVIEDVKPGRVRIDLGDEVLIVTDWEKSFTADDFSATDFVF